MVSFETKELYGGAITTQIPKGLIDASDLRQIPDTQEVFLNPSENTKDYTILHKDDSIIVDLMERIEGEDLEAIKEHFSEIAALNDSSNSWKLFAVDQTSNKLNTKAYIAIGLEPAMKWGRDESKGLDYKPTLAVVLGIIRLDKVETDVLITQNVLISDKEELQDLEKLTDLSDEQNKAAKRISLADGIVKQAINTLEIKDWNLFG
ncbi:Ran guanine nucleotide release factor [Wickerhamomyces ciferrii]|uniref:Ran guanine nucleotide release factor n=1 Tax=Wickerhamomyces ciferrii (strain ATCC 14091 / BCRC 22168 / CBS 111 / JCM 3599 / NBRC 0793 / NRRL Y-1031 F-60-10) TaxID=1206466 RepID=K0KIM4_WICCF|nr:Ran guanine nucleotide release factor [Wickerhamomyces ciferrii]CCH41013.1 Ran guanine nucleotide release factor [Wickerhamomyces ciferrii]